MLGDDWKNTVKRINGRDGIFGKSSRWYTSWQRAQVWNLKSPGCQVSSSNREIPGMLIPPCVQNVPGKNDELSPSGYSLHPRESGPKFAKDHVTWLHVRPCLVPSWCGASRTIWDCCWSQDIPVPLGRYSRTPSEVVQEPGGVATSPTLLGPVLVWSQQNCLRLLLNVRYIGSSKDTKLQRSFSAFWFYKCYWLGLTAWWQKSSISSPALVYF